MHFFGEVAQCSYNRNNNSFYLLRIGIFLKGALHMQLTFSKTNSSGYTITGFQGIDQATCQRLHSLGLQLGSVVRLVRQYPFHGPVIIEADNQQIGIRYAVFKQLTGGY